MMRALGVILPCLALQLTVAVGPAQALAQLDPGSRVRVTSEKGKQTGTLVALDGDTLRYTRLKASSVTALPRASVVRLERSVGKRPATGRGALIGGLIGGGFGLFLGIAASTDDTGWFEVGPGEVAAAAAFTGAIGAGLGALIGAASRQDRWEAVPLEPPVAGR
jgi:hypothetical protein